MSLGVFFLFDVLSFFFFFFLFFFFPLFFDYYYVLHAYDCYTCVDAACGSISKEQRSGCLFLVHVVCLSHACCHEGGTLFHVPPVLFSPNRLRLPLPFPSLPQTTTITTTTTTPLLQIYVLPPVSSIHLPIRDPWTHARDWLSLAHVSTTTLLSSDTNVVNASTSFLPCTVHPHQMTHTSAFYQSIQISNHSMSSCIPDGV
ncbi:uncharacterized protein IWZ02DRAFT_205751 [Phyllosticta citriasiana]|uniref:uncharacterized protein n=1 Tax=Phyllosticta citriasiana TaxID=595635 RepID=UPI0030FDBFFD